MNLSDLRVLVVDDDELLSLQVCMQLRALGVATIEQANDPAEINNTVRNAVVMSDTDVIFLDLYMPEIDGFEVLKKLSDVGFQGTIAGFSGAGRELIGMATRLAEAYDLKIITLPSKPVKANDLLGLLEEAVKRSTELQSPPTGDKLSKTGHV